MTDAFACCKSGFFHEGQTKGSVDTICDLDCYIARGSKKGAILIISDVFGWSINNIRMLADRYSQETGLTVYVVDFFQGDHAPFDPAEKANWDAAAFFQKHPLDAHEARTKVALAIKAEHGTLGVIGFCWGAPSTLYLGSGDCIADAIAVAHPSKVEPEDFADIRVPFLLLACEHDPQLPEPKRHAVEKVLGQVVADAAKGGKRKAWAKVAYYPGTTHGDMVRGDEKNEYIALCMGDAQKEASIFFSRFLNAK